MSGYSARLKMKMPVMPSTVASRTEQCQTQITFVAIEHLFELVVEPAVETRAPAFWRGGRFTFHRGRDAL